MGCRKFSVARYEPRKQICHNFLQVTSSHPLHKYSSLLIERLWQIWIHQENTKCSGEWGYLFKVVQYCWKKSFLPRCWVLHCVPPLGRSGGDLSTIVQIDDTASLHLSSSATARSMSTALNSSLAAWSGALCTNQRSSGERTLCAWMRRTTSSSSKALKTSCLSEMKCLL